MLLRPPLRLASKVNRAHPTHRFGSKHLQQGLLALPRANSVEPKQDFNGILPRHLSRRATRPVSSNLRRPLREPCISVNKPEVRPPAPTTSRERCHSSFVLRMNKLESALDADFKYREKLEIPQGFFSPKSSASTRAATPQAR